MFDGIGQPSPIISIKKGFIINPKDDLDQARKMKNANIGITIPVEKEITRNQLDQKKAEHFLDFIFNSNLLQDVAYGVTKIKFDLNDVYKISRAVLTAKMSHTIAFYNEVCRSENYSPLSESSLWRILHAVKPSQQKCLAGLDDITALCKTLQSFIVPWQLYNRSSFYVVQK